MGFRVSTVKPLHRRLFWIAIILLLLAAVGWIVAAPTSPAPTGAAPVFISEFAATNDGRLLVDEDGDPSDWIELFNRSSAPVNLADWTLTDDPDRPEKWTFADYVIEPSERLIVFASGKNRREIELDDESGEPGHLHANFKLSADPGFLALYPPTTRRYLDGTDIDYPQQQPGISYGLPDGSGATVDVFGYLATPSPGEPNPDNSAWQGMTPLVGFSEPSGLYEKPISLKLTNATAGSEIRFTLDGSEPTSEHGRVYAEPIDISGTAIVRAVSVAPNHRSAAVTTRSYLFIDDAIAQSALADGFPEEWGVHKVDIGGYTVGQPVVADYEVDPRIVNDPVYGPQLRDALFALPIVSLATDVANLDIYADPQTRGREAERPVSVELFDSLGGESGFQVDAGMRIQGGAGRWEFMPKHSLRLFFRSEYGSPQLEYAVFSDSPATEYDTLVLRAGVDRSFAGHPSLPDAEVDHREATYAHDEWTRASQIAMSDAGSHGRFVHLFLNGLYWGIYNVVERPDANFMATYFGGDDSEYGAVNHAGSVSGPIDRFSALVRLAQGGDLGEPDTYATMLEFIDPIQFSDYMILNWYVGNRDWPENNWYAGARYPASPNLFFVWDAETTLHDGAEIVLGGDGFEGAPFPNVIRLVFEALMENPDFRLTFADRLHRHTSEGGALSDAEAQQRWLDITDPLETAIIAESARWGDVRTDSPITQADWLSAREDVLGQMAGNGAKLRQLARDAGYYPSVDPPRFGVTDPVLEENLLLTIEWGSGEVGGEIYYTTDGTDPRLSGSGEISPSAVRYVEPLILTDATHVKARALSGSDWSPLSERQFRHADQAANVRITELMYNPVGGERYEYVELANLGEIVADLSGAYFEGIDFRFPRYTRLAPGEVTVLVADFRRFRERYPEPEIGGIFADKLSDRGESITLFDVNGNVLDSVTYNDEDGWPLSADGTGDSLELVDPDGDPNQSFRWRASEAANGSPGSQAE